MGVGGERVGGGGSKKRRSRLEVDSVAFSCLNIFLEVDQVDLVNKVIVILPVNTDVLPESLVHQGFAQCEEHVEQPGVVHDVDPEVSGALF